MRYLFALFVIVPILEMWLLLKVGSIIGAMPTIGLVVLTAVIGISLLKRQGLEILWRGQKKLESGELPAAEVAEGLILAIAGALLLTPGFCTDGIGFICLTPPLRRRLVAHLARRMMVLSVQRQDNMTYTSSLHGGTTAENRQGETIEGEFREEK